MVNFSTNQDQRPGNTANEIQFFCRLFVADMPHHYYSSFSILVQTDDDADIDLSVSSTKEEDYAISLNGDDILWEEYSSDSSDNQSDLDIFE